jgi:hypothetical protein
MLTFALESIKADAVITSMKTFALALAALLPLLLTSNPAAADRGDRGGPSRGDASSRHIDSRQGSPSPQGNRGSSDGRSATPNLPGGMGAGPSFATPAPVRRIAPAREAQRGPQQNHSRDWRSGSTRHWDHDRDRNIEHRVHDHPAMHRPPSYRPPVHYSSGHRPPWRGDIRHFHRHDFHTWQRGHWYHAHHGGRLGWWWVIGPTWYFYPAPVYPYPNPYVPPVIVVQSAPSTETQYWYYCDDPQGYYPYLNECNEEWEPVPAEPDADMPPE